MVSRQTGWPVCQWGGSFCICFISYSILVMHIYVESHDAHGHIICIGHTVFIGYDIRIGVLWIPVVGSNCCGGRGVKRSGVSSPCTTAVDSGGVVRILQTHFKLAQLVLSWVAPMLVPAIECHHHCTHHHHQPHCCGDQPRQNRIHW